MEIKTIWVLEGKGGFLDTVYALSTDGKMYKWNYQKGIAPVNKARLVSSETILSEPIQSSI